MLGKNLTPEQIDKLIRSYLAVGTAGTKALCTEYGVSFKHPACLARIYADKYGHKPGTSKSRNDPRWEWAIERGSVVI